MASQQTHRPTTNRGSRFTTRATIGLVLTTVMVPLVILAIGVWEMQRGDADRWNFEIQRGYLGQTVQRMEAWIAANPRREIEVQFRRNGQLFGGPYAVQNAREALDDAAIAVAIERWRRVLPPVTIGCAGLILAKSVLVLAGAAGLARAGRTSRDALVRGFSVLHRLLPPLLGLQVVLLAVCTAALFTPDPIVVLGRAVSAQKAPGLWRLLDDLAAKLGALRPDNVLVGLTGDPAPRLDQRQLHPTDTHPPTKQRLAALGREPDPAMLTEAASPPRPEAMALLSELFADPGALCRTATVDFLDLARSCVLAMHQALRAAAAAAAVHGEEQALQENVRASVIFTASAAFFFVLIGVALLLFGMPGLRGSESRLVGGLASAALA